MANLAVAPDDGRAFDHRAGFNRGAFTEENFLPDARAGKSSGRVLTRLTDDVVLYFFERFPFCCSFLFFKSFLQCLFCLLHLQQFF